MASQSDVNALTLKVATFESRMTVIEAKQAILQSQLDNNAKSDATLANDLYTLGGELQSTEAKLGVK